MFTMSPNTCLPCPRTVHGREREALPYVINELIVHSIGPLSRKRERVRVRGKNALSPLIPLQKRQQIRIQLVLMRHGKTVRAILIHFQLRTRNHLVHQLTGGFKRHHLVMTAVDHQRRHIHLRNIRTEIRLRERGHAIQCTFQRRQQRNVQRLRQYPIGNRLARVGAVKRRGELFDKLRTILRKPALIPSNTADSTPSG